METDVANEINAILDEIAPVCNNFIMTNVYSPVVDVYKDCIEATKANALNADHTIKIESVIDFIHDELHSGYWKDVAISTRQAYTAANIVKIIIKFKQQPKIMQEDIRNAIKIVDMAILLGAPIEDSEECLPALASRLSQILLVKKIEDDNTTDSNSNKNCLQSNETIFKVSDGDSKKKRYKDDYGVYEKLTGKEIVCNSELSITDFVQNFLMHEIPVKITNCMSNWDACKKWMDIQYLLKFAGCRTVPIEIGSQYSDENWTQKLMAFEEFVKNFYLKDDGEKGYLAQHNLFDQVPELFNDIAYPHYCFTSRDGREISDDPDVNAWFGPKGTVSSLHYDPRDNILAQVFGAKQIILFSPKDSEYLYPHDTQLLSNTAQVDPVEPNLTEFPNFTKAKMYKCLLEAGEMLFIPRKWWHHVTSLEKSFSVNFWWGE